LNEKNRVLRRILVDVEPTVADVIANYKADFRTIDFSKSPVRSVLAGVIASYESDTFSASVLKLTVKEAFAMADFQLRAFIDVVAYGGRFHSDGDTLWEILYRVRREARTAERNNA